VEAEGVGEAVDGDRAELLPPQLESPKTIARHMAIRRNDRNFI
jgi:hypothetical protein